jgi:hypothetical protein
VISPDFAILLRGQTSLGYNQSSLYHKHRFIFLGTGGKLLPCVRRYINTYESLPVPPVPPVPLFYRVYTILSLIEELCKTAGPAGLRDRRRDYPRKKQIYIYTYLYLPVCLDASGFISWWSSSSAAVTTGKRSPISMLLLRFWYETRPLLRQNVFSA